MSGIWNFIKSGLIGGGIGAVAGFTFGGPVGAAIGAIGGAGTGIAAAASGMQGGTGAALGTVGGALTGFMIGGPIGALVGGALGFFGGKAIGGMFNHKEQPPQQAQNYPPMMPGMNQMMMPGMMNQMMMPGMMSMMDPSMMMMMQQGMMQPGMGMMMMPGAGGMQMNMQMGAMPGGYQMNMTMGMYGSQGMPMMQGWGMGQPIQGGQLSQEGDGKPISYTTSGGYKVTVNGHDVIVTDPNGKNTVKQWGDPHENVNGKTIKDWEGKTRTLVLGDGTKITMNADGPQGVINNTSIYDGAQAIEINNKGNQVTGVSFNPYQSAMKELYQPDGETAFVGYNKAGEFTYTNMYTQNNDLSIQNNYKVLAGSDKNFWQQPFSPPPFARLPWA